MQSGKVCFKERISQALYSARVLCCKQQKLVTGHKKVTWKAVQDMVHEWCRALRMRLRKLVRDKEQKTPSPDLGFQVRTILLTPLHWAFEAPLARISVALTPLGSWGSV